MCVVCVHVMCVCVCACVCGVVRQVGPCNQTFGFTREFEKPAAGDQSVAITPFAATHSGFLLQVWERGG